MTKWKKYIKSKGFMLESDYPMIPYDTGKGQSILGIYTYILDDCIRVITEFSSLVCYADITRDGKEVYKYN